MELYKREFLISRIRAGYIPIDLENKRLIIYHPDLDTLLAAQELFIREYEEAVEEELFQDSDVYKLLIDIDLWSEQKEKELNEIIPGHIEYWKIELYRSILKSNTRETIRKYLKTAKEEYGKLYQIRHSFDHITCFGYASYVKNMFIISECARCKNKRVNWKTFDLNKVMSLYHENILDSDAIRALARSYPWSGLWPTLKINGKIFENSELTSEQQTLISWSVMYDRIYESPDCPPEEVIEDDDLLDGWLLIQKRQREADKKKHEIENVANKKIGNADEIYLMVETPQDSQKVELLNDVRAAQIKQQRLKQIKEKGNVLEQQLADVKFKRAMEIQQAYVNKVKGR